MRSAGAALSLLSPRGLELTPELLQSPDVARELGPVMADITVLTSPDPDRGVAGGVAQNDGTKSKEV